MMKNIIFIVFFALIQGHLLGQFGLNPIYQLSSNSGDWDVLAGDNNNFQGPGVGASLDYWFRLKNYRVEFLGEVSYVVGDFQHPQLSSDWSELGFTMNTNFYVFDLEGDCNCPTFGKDGTVFEKGFYLQLGLGLINLNADNVSQSFGGNEALTSDGSNWSPAVHLGAGLDIGMGEYFTITPWLRYRYRFNTTWPGLSDLEVTDSADEQDSTSQGILMGIRLGYRWDYKRRY